MSTRREEITNRLLILRGLRDLIAAEDARLREEAAELFTRPGTKEVGELYGEPIGTVRLDKAVSTWAVVDEAAFTAWVGKHRPEEIEPAVRPSYEKAVLAHLKSEGALVEESTGELIVPDGVAPRKGEPKLVVSAPKETAQVVLAALGDKAVTLGLAEPAELLP